MKSKPKKKVKTAHDVHSHHHDIEMYGIIMVPPPFSVGQLYFKGQRRHYLF
jgi:hypothetical protein